MPEKYRVYWVNFHYYAEDEFDTLDAAVAYVNSKSFEAAIDFGGNIVASKTTFSGWSIVPDKLVPRSFTELRKGDVVLFEHDFHKVAVVLGSNRTETFVEFEDGGDAIFDGLVFTKG